MNTTTPDGLYHFKMPASWRLLASGTHVVLLDPKNSGVVILDERFLGQTIDATAVAKQISTGFKGTLNVQGKWTYLGSKDKAAFTGLVTEKGKTSTLASVNLVIPFTQFVQSVARLRLRQCHDRFGYQPRRY